MRDKKENSLLFDREKKKTANFAFDFSEVQMKKIVFGCCLLIFIASCGGNGKKVDPFEKLTEQLDSMNVGSDSVLQDTMVLVEEVIPVTVDESFADFFYNFASDEKFQRSRILFPMPYYEGKEVKRISREAWKFDPLFSRQDAYTILFDKAEEMEMEKDTSLHSVQVEWIYLKEKRVKRYYFERKKDAWFLEAINWEKLAHGEGSEEDFLTFYEHFASDSIFQRERLHHPLLFVTADPEDEFQILETTLDIGQWFAFRPPMMKEKLTNVRYGQTETLTSDTKVVEFKGFGDGFSNVMYFERRHGIWKLMKFEDLSD